MQPKRILMFTAIAVVAVVAANYAYRSFSTKPQAASQPINTNDYLETEVKKRLADSGVLKDDNVSVSAQDGTVTLSGTVGAEWRRISAENIASSTPAVLAVTNLIKVREPEAAPMPVWKSSSAGSASAAPEMATRKRAYRPYVDPATRARELAAEGNYQVSLKNYPAAVKAFRAALELDPNNYEARSGLQEAQRMR